MKGKMIASFGLWFFLLVLTGMVTIFANSFYGMVAALLWILLPLVTWGLNFVVRKKLSVQILITPTASKNQETEGTIILENDGFLVMGKAISQVTVQNSLTGEKQTVLLEIPLKAKGETVGKFHIASAHCGYVRVKLERLVLTEWFGFLPVRCKAEAKGNVSILPDTFPSQVSLEMLYAKSEDAQMWSQEKRGEDSTEIFSLRDYVEGDSLKQIHWKLSSKRNQLIVKEASLPTTKSLMLFWDKNTVTATAAEMDAMAEVVASVSQSIEDSGVAFTLGWTEGQECIFEEIETEDDLIQVLPRMIKKGWDSTRNDGGFLQEALREKGEFGKIIYFAKTIPKDISQMSDMNLTFVLCTKNDMHTEWRTCTFSEETYLKDMEAVEL